MGSGDEHTDVAQMNAAERDFERIDGELDAAIVFAVTAAANLNDLGSATLSDARACYSNALEAMNRADLSGAQMQQLQAKILRLRQILGAIPGSSTNVAA